MDFLDIIHFAQPLGNKINMTVDQFSRLSDPVKSMCQLNPTRVHSSRMRTARSLTVSRSIRFSGRLPNPPDAVSPQADPPHPG